MEVSNLVISVPALRKLLHWLHPLHLPPGETKTIEKILLTKIKIQIAWQRYVVHQMSKCKLDDHLFHIVYFRDIKLQHVLNPVPQGHCRAGTPCARPDELQFDRTILKTFIDDITSILLHCRPSNVKETITMLNRTKNKQDRLGEIRRIAVQSGEHKLWVLCRTIPQRKWHINHPTRSFPTGTNWLVPDSGVEKLLYHRYDIVIIFRESYNTENLECGGLHVTIHSAATA